MQKKGVYMSKHLVKCDMCGKEWLINKKDYNARMKKRGVIKCRSCSNTRHKNFNKRLDYVYYDMISRCYNENNVAFNRYGGKGITVCEEWKKDKSSFFSWALLNGYNDNLTIDRIDNNSNYSPYNCRFVGYKEQAINKNNNINITVSQLEKIKSSTSSISELAEEYTVSRPTIKLLKKMEVTIIGNKVYTTKINERKEKNETR